LPGVLASHCVVLLHATATRRLRRRTRGAGLFQALLQRHSPRDQVWRQVDGMWAKKTINAPADIV